jgi:hypothetical protein
MEYHQKRQRYQVVTWDGTNQAEIEAFVTSRLPNDDTAEFILDDDNVLLVRVNGIRRYPVPLGQCLVFGPYWSSDSTTGTLNVMSTAAFADRFEEVPVGT